jgi:hypothetical protein
MMKFQNVLLACALGAGSLFSAVAPASAAPAPVGRVSGTDVRSLQTGRVLPGNRFYGTGYRYGYPYGYGYRYGFGYPYRYGYGYGYGYGVGVGVGYSYGYGGLGYGYAGGGYGYTPYPAVYGAPAYWVRRRPYWRPYRRVYWGARFVR